MAQPLAAADIAPSAGGVDPDFVKQVVKYLGTGAALGGLGGLATSLFQGGDFPTYLRNTLAGTLLGGLGGGLSLSLMDPSRKRRLANQLLLSRIPSPGGFRRRVHHLGQTAQALQFGSPYSRRAVTTARRFIRDPQTSAMLGRAAELLKGRRRYAPESRLALSALGARISERLPTYRRAIRGIDRLHAMRRRYATGELGSTGIAQRMQLMFGQRAGPERGTGTLLQNLLRQPFTVRETRR
jgi:hypothetical protein